MNSKGLSLLLILIFFGITSLGFAQDDNDQRHNFEEADLDSIRGVEDLQAIEEERLLEVPVDFIEPEEDFAIPPPPNTNIVAKTALAVSWDGGAGTSNWNDAANWSNDVVPTNADDITLVSGDYVEIITGSNGVANSVLLQSGASLVIGSLTLTVDSTFDLNSGASLSLSGDLNVGFNLLLDGTFTANSGSDVFLNGSGNQNVSGATFYNLYMSSGGTVTATGNLDVNNQLRIYNGVTFNPSSYDHTIEGYFRNDGTLALGSGSINMDGTGTQIIYSNLSGGAPGVFNFNDLIISGNAGTVYVYDTLNVDGDLTVNGGDNLLLNDYATVSSFGIISGNGGTFTLTSGADLYIRTTRTNGTGGADDNFPTGFNTININTTGYVYYQSNTDQIIRTLDGDGDQIIYGRIYLYRLNSGNFPTKMPDGDLDVNESIYIGTQATFDVTSGNHNINIAGNWYNSGVSFNPRGGAVTFDGAAQSITGSNATTFYDLTLAGSGNKILYRNTTVNNNCIISAGVSYLNLQTYLLSGGGTSSFTLGANVLLYVRATANFPAFNSYSIDATSTIRYDFAGSQTVQTGITYGNLFFASGGTKTVDGVINNLTVNGELDIAAGTTFDIDDVTGFTLFLNGDYDNNGTINSTANPTTLELGGSGNVLFDAGGIIAGRELYDLTVNKTGGEAILGNTVLITNDFNLTAGSFGISVTNRNMYVEGDWTKAAGATFLHGTATVFFQGTSQTISGDGSNDFHHMDISGGTKTLGDDVDANGNVIIQSGGTLDLSGSNYTLQVGLTFNNNNGGSFDARNGTLTFDGSSNSTLYIGPTDSLYNLTLNKSGGAYIYYDEHDLKVANNINVINGELYPGRNSSMANEETDIYIYGNFSSTGSYRATTDDTVHFVGTTQSLSATGTDDFNYVSFEGSGTKTITSNVDINRSLDIASGSTLAIAGSNIVKIGRNFVNNGAFTPNTSTLEFDEYAGWNPITITTNGDSVYNLIIDLLNAGYDFDLQDNLTVINDLTVTQGDLDITTNNYSLTVGGSWTIETNGELQPNSGTVFFTGIGAGSSETITTNSEPFFRVEFDATGTSYFQQDIMYVDDDMYINNGAFHLNGQELWAGTASGDSVSVSDSLIVDAGSQLKLDSGVDLIVESGGHIDVVGVEGDPATVTNQGTGNYTFDVASGASIGARYFVFEYMDASGINVNDGSTVDGTNNFGDGTFTNGLSGGTLLTIDNSQTINPITNTSFPQDPGGATNNVTKNLNQGALTFLDPGGAFSGAAFEDDPNNLITWSFTSSEVVWDGSASTDWSTAANWDIGSVPNASNRVRIPSAPSNQPVITSTTDSTFHLTIESGATLSVGTGGSPGKLAITGDINILGTLQFDNSADTLWIEGDWSNSSGTFTNNGNGAVIFTGTIDQNIITGGTGTTKRFNNLAIQKTGGTASLNDNIRTDGNFYIVDGIFDVNSGNFSVQVGADWLHADTAVFVNQQGTVTMSGNSALITGTGTDDFYNLVIDADTVTLNRAIEISNNLTINGSAELDASASNYGITIINSWTNNGEFIPQGGNVVFNGANQTISGTATTVFNDATFSGSGTKTLSAAVETNGDISINSVTFDMNANSITGNGASNTFTLEGAAQLYVEGSSNFPAGYEDFSLSSTSFVRYNLAGDQTVVGLDADGDAIEYGYLYLTNSGTKTANGTIDANNNLYIANNVTFDLNSNDMFLGVYFDNNQGGSFTPGTGNTVTFDREGTQYLYPSSGGDNFPSLVFAGTGAKVLSGDITLSGDLTLNSTITYLNVLTNTITGSGGTNTINISSGVDLYVRGSNNFPTGFETINLASTSRINYDGNLAQTIVTTDGDGDQIQYGEINFRYNTKTLDGDLDLRGRFYMYAATTLDADAANSYNINAGAYWYNLGTTNLYSNTVTFDGSDNQYIYTYGTTDAKKFNHLVINKPSDSELRFYNYDVQVDSNMTVSSGILYPVGRIVTVEGNWNTTSSASMFDANGTINFAGVDQTIAGQGSADFYNITLNGTGTKTLTGPIYVLNDITIGAGDTLDVSANNYQITLEGDFTNPGTFIYRQGTVEFTSTVTQYINTNGITAAKQFYDLTVNKASGICYLGGDLYVNNNINLQGTTSGSFRPNGNDVTLLNSWYNTGPLYFVHGSGQVTFAGTSRDTIQTGYTGSFQNQFYDLVINHTDSIIHVDDIRVDNNYDFQQGHALLNGNTFYFGITNGSGDLFDINASNGNATFEIGAGGNLNVRNGNDVNVASASNTSTIKVVGSDGNNANVSYYGTAQYGFTVAAGGVIYARYYTFSYMDAAGIYIDGGQIAGAGADTTEDFSNGTFENGVTAGRYLYINNDQTMQIDSVTFATSLGGSGENVNKPNDAGNLTFFNATGVYADSIYENDPFNRIDWITNITSYTWTGTVNSDWHNTGNWDSGLVPGDSNSVTIPNVTNDPLISTADAECASLTIESGGLLQIGGFRDLAVNGDLQISGTLTVFGTDTVSVTGSYTNSGTLNPGTGSFVFSGISQTLNSGGTGSTRRFNNILFTNNTIVTLSSQNLWVNKNITINSGSSLDVSPSNRQIFVGGVWTNSGSFVYRSGTVEFNGSSAQTVSGSGTDDFYNLEFSGTGTKTLSGTIDINGTLLVNSGATVDAGTANLSIEIYLTNNGTFTATNSSITFDRSGTQYINGSNSPVLGNVTFSGSGAKILSNNITVNGQLAVNSGVTYLNIDTYSVNGVGGSDTFTLGSLVRLYVRNADNFPTNFETVTLAADSYVRYDGTMNQTIRTRDADADSIYYGWLELYHQASATKRWTLENSDLYVAGRLYVQAGDTLDVTTNNYNITVGEYYYNYGSLEANGASVQNTLTMNGSGTQYIQALGSGTGNELYNIVINKPSGICYISGLADLYINNDLSIISGEFDANGTRDIYIEGDWINSGTYAPDNSDVHFSASNYSGNITSNGSPFYNVTFDGTNTHYTLQDAMTLNEDLNISATDTLDLNGQILSIGNAADEANVSGLLDVDAGAQLRLYTGTSLTVASGGRINIVGTAGNIARVTRSSGSGSYNFEVQSGAEIAARNFLFEYMNQSGIYINGGTIDSTNNFSDGTFTNGATNGKFLAIFNNSQDLSGANKITEVQFPSDPGGTSYNVYVTNSSGGNYVIEDASGTFEGAAYEYDPDNVVNWTYTTITRTWTGSTSSNWFTASNWSPQAVPADSEFVVIETASNLPTISSADAAIKSLTITSGSLTLTAGNNLTVEDNISIGSGTSLNIGSNSDTVFVGGDWSNSGTYSHGNSALVIQGVALQNLESGGTGSGKRVYDLIINKGATAQISLSSDNLRVENDLLLNSGILSFGNLDVESQGNFTNSGGSFQSGTGTLTFLGAETDSITTNGSDLYDLTINTPGGSLRSMDDIRIANNLQITAGTFYTNGQEVSVGAGTANLVSIQGELDVNTNASFLIQGGSQGITVESGGQLTAIGTNASNLAEISRYGGSGYYPIILNSGSTISARFAKFAYTNGSGVDVSAGAAIDLANNFEGCVFENGSGTSYLNISNSQTLGTAEDVTFSAGGSPPTYNVLYDGSGSILFNNYKGDLASARYESDNGAGNGNVRWTFNETQSVSQGNTYTFGNDFVITINTIGDLSSITVQLIDNAFVDSLTFERHYNVTTVPVSPSGFDVDIRSYYSDGTNNSSNEIPNGENDNLSYLWFQSGSNPAEGPHRSSANTSQNWIQYSGVTSAFSAGNWFPSNQSEDTGLPVELSAFSAMAEEKGITLEWVTESEINNLKWIIERKIDNSPDDALMIAELEGQGTTSSQTIYSFTDTELEVGTTYEYTLKSVSYSGVIVKEGSITVTALLPTKLELAQNYPNPFNGKTKIKFALPDAALIRVTIYNTLGQKIKTIVNKRFEAGFHVVNWDGRNESGMMTASGIYFYVLNSKKTNIVKKMVMVK